ncbi:hypothetical protein BDV36DRAFT_272366 [Aspergillus pseudocaelatus]|uniref:Uncharacterized protein n=1 Tax=Aspergillus pseudocaelatus TaxID=1825620 RepID=A0ABQ6W4Q4_9EURO|nr:hypothetical protein BDV36DRAFT_272366 [Aspergillus pseudocaelatus]
MYLQCKPVPKKNPKTGDPGLHSHMHHGSLQLKPGSRRLRGETAQALDDTKKMDPSALSKEGREIG